MTTRDGGIERLEGNEAEAARKRIHAKHPDYYFPEKGPVFRVKKQQRGWLRTTLADWCRWFILAAMMAVLLLTLWQVWGGTGW